MNWITSDLFELEIYGIVETVPFLNFLFHDSIECLLYSSSTMSLDRIKTMAKKKQKSFQKELKEQKEKVEKKSVVDGKTVFHDQLTTTNRIGFCLVSYILFFAGSISCLILGLAGTEKSGSGEVKIIGIANMIVHLLFFALIVINVSVFGIMTIKAIFILLILLPLVILIVGLFQKSVYGTTLKTLALVMIIPHYAVIGLVNPSVLWDKGRENEIIVKANTNAINNAVGKFEYERKAYPAGLNDLVDASFLKSIPVNPFTSQVTRNIKFGEKPSAGEITYLPIDFDGSYKAYYLFSYGREETSGTDVNNDKVPDHVISLHEGMIPMYDLPEAEYKKLLREKPLLRTLLK